MTNCRLAPDVATAYGPQPEFLPHVTCGPMTIRMAVMALIMGGAGATAGRRA